MGEFKAVYSICNSYNYWTVVLLRSDFGLVLKKSESDILPVNVNIFHLGIFRIFVIPHTLHVFVNHVDTDTQNLLVK